MVDATWRTRWSGVPGFWSLSRVETRAESARRMGGFSWRGSAVRPPRHGNRLGGVGIRRVRQLHQARRYERRLPPVGVQLDDDA